MCISPNFALGTPRSDAPPAKRQKMSSYGSSHAALKQQDSFTEVLAQLEADAESAEYAQGGGVEGEADGQRKIGHIETSAAWPRPALGKWNAQTDKIGKLLPTRDALPQES